MVQWSHSLLGIRSSGAAPPLPFFVHDYCPLLGRKTCGTGKGLIITSKQTKGPSWQVARLCPSTSRPFASRFSLLLVGRPMAPRGGAGLHTSHLAGPTAAGARRPGRFVDSHCARVSWCCKHQGPHRPGRSRSKYRNANSNQNNAAPMHMTNPKKSAYSLQIGQPIGRVPPRFTSAHIGANPCLIIALPFQVTHTSRVG